ncbi:hypothetical protein BDW22DRAFT_1431805 [Trametopsis cervina]|nr:hypothetical protein BDW22DRAFT_1431805 [Trametopsis cervina]
MSRRYTIFEVVSSKLRHIDTNVFTPDLETPAQALICRAETFTETLSSSDGFWSIYKACAYNSPPPKTMSGVNYQEAFNRHRFLSIDQFLPFSIIDFSGTLFVVYEHATDRPKGDTEEEEAPNELLQHQERAFERAQKAAPPSDVLNDMTKWPSEQEENPIYNGRCLRLGLPVSVFDPVIAQLQDDIENIQSFKAKASTLTGTAKLFTIVQNAHRYFSDSDLRRAIWSTLQSLLELRSSDMGTSYASRDVGCGPSPSNLAFWVKVEGESDSCAIPLHIQLKPHLCEADIQSVLEYRKLIALEPHLLGIAYATHLPCIHIAIAGPYIRISVSIQGEDLFVHHLTDYMAIIGPGGHQYIRRHIEHIAKHFDVVRCALHRLRKYYQGVVPRSKEQQDLTRFFPNPTRLDSKPPLADLVYERRINFGEEHNEYTCSMWRALYKGQPALVKFAERYSVRAHRILADHEPAMAPKLYFAEKLLGGVWMIVMEFLGGYSAAALFNDDTSLPQSVVADLEVALDLLHRDGIVHGDVRRPNIMLHAEKGEYRAKLVDFDFSGRDIDGSDDDDGGSVIFDNEDEVGSQHYDLLISGDAGFVKGIQPCGRMRMKHDLQMLERISHEFVWYQ